MTSNYKNNILEILSHNILYLRKKHNLTKKEMSLILGVGIKTLNELEQGLLPPRLSVSVLFKIKDSFGVSLKNQVSVKL